MSSFSIHIHIPKRIPRIKFSTSVEYNQEYDTIRYSTITVIYPFLRSTCASVITLGVRREISDLWSIFPRSCKSSIHLPEYVPHTPVTNNHYSQSENKLRRNSGKSGWGTWIKSLNPKPELWYWYSLNFWEKKKVTRTKLGMVDD
jgi:hypothetical protein